MEAEPNKVFFRVINGDKVGPVSELKISDNRKHELWGSRMVLGRAGDDRIWFLNTLEINTLYELKLVDVK
jgi:hypothetical protein